MLSYMNSIHNFLTTTSILLIFLAFTFNVSVTALRQLEPPNPDDITKGLPTRSNVEPEPTKSKFKGKSIGGIEIPKETQIHHIKVENSGIYNGNEIKYSWIILSIVCASLIGRKDNTEEESCSRMEDE
ncbi:3084_t:CDS:2, partial [Scutellospora calospora]